MSRPPDTSRFPPGTTVTVPGVGPTFVRLGAGPTDAPTVLLLHGWTSTADITWAGAYPALAGRFPLVAPDLRGHGGGPRGGRPDGIGVIARDVAALLETLAVGPCIVAGYSSGGAVAQLLARERRDLVAGLVLGASAHRLARTVPEHLRLAALRAAAGLAWALPDAIPKAIGLAVLRVLYGNDELQRWVRAGARRHRWADVLALGGALDAFDSRGWVHEVDVPAAVVLTEGDSYVAPARQFELAAALGAEIFPIAGDHGVCLGRPGEFGSVVLAACRHVAERAGEPDHDATMPAGR